MFEIIKISLITFMFAALVQEPHTPLTWYGKLLDKLPWYLQKPLGGCYRCVTGEVLLWYYVFTFDHYSLIDNLFYPSFGIICSMVYNMIYCTLKNKKWHNTTAHQQETIQPERER